MPSQQLRRVEESTEDTVGAYRSAKSEEVESVASVLRQAEEQITSVPSRQDSLVTAAGITVAFRVLEWVIFWATSNWLYSLFAYLMTSGLYLPSAMSGVRFTNFVIGAALAVAVGLIVGRVAPRRAMVGIAIGSGIGWVAWLLVTLFWIARVSSAALTSALVMNFVFSSLLSVVTVMTTEILIARWVARKQFQKARTASD